MWKSVIWYKLQGVGSCEYVSLYELPIVGPSSFWPGSVDLYDFDLLDKYSAS